MIRESIEISVAHKEIELERKYSMDVEGGRKKKKRENWFWCDNILVIRIVIRAMV